MSWHRTWRMLRQVVSMDLVATATYRGHMLIFILMAVVSPIIGLFVWRATLAAGADLPRDASFFTTYFLMLTVVNWLTSVWGALFTAESIRSGTISRRLVMPMSPHLLGISNNITEKLIKGCFLVPLMVAVGFAFRDSLALPTDSGRWLMFLASVLAAAVLNYTFDLLVGTLAFWIEDVGAIERGQGLVSGVLGGALVPLALMPDWLAGPLVAQPFRYIYSFPLEIITGDVTGADLVLGFVLQGVWLGTILWLTRTTWKRGLRGYAAFGS